MVRIHDFFLLFRNHDRNYTQNVYPSYLTFFRPVSYTHLVKNNRIYLDGDSNQLEYITIGIIPENPADVADCFDPNAPYPAPAHMIPTIKDLIFSKELRIMPQMPSDDTNNSQDNT